MSGLEGDLSRVLDLRPAGARAIGVLLAFIYTHELDWNSPLRLIDMNATASDHIPRRLGPATNDRFFLPWSQENFFELSLAFCHAWQLACDLEWPAPKPQLAWDLVNNSLEKHLFHDHTAFRVFFDTLGESEEGWAAEIIGEILVKHGRHQEQLGDDFKLVLAGSLYSEVWRYTSRSFDKFTGSCRKLYI
jgi:hypothetical protein